MGGGVKGGASRHGWFKLPGQRGDRAVDQQLLGLQPALEAAVGRSILDLGCAEGAIALEFLRAGAEFVQGIEIVESHLAVAVKICKGLSCDFKHADLNKPVELVRKEFDIVLALAIIHKLKNPAGILRYYAGMARELVVIRMPSWARGPRFAHERGRGELIDCAKELAALGFSLERIERGPQSERGQEPVVYFRRRA